MPGGLEPPPDDDAYRPPLPPQDRVWRHPSEFAAEQARAAGARGGPGHTHLRSVLTVGITAAVVVVAVVIVGGALELSHTPQAPAGQVVRLTSSSMRPTTSLASTAGLDASPRVRLGIAGIDTAFGVQVTQCTLGSAAAMAGLRAGDVLVSVDHERVLRMADVVDALRDVTPRSHVVVTVVRDGAHLELDIALGNRA